MRTLCLTIFLLISAPGAATAQNAEPRRSHGYLFVAPGGVSEGGGATLQFGVGGEGLVHRGLGLGAEIGFLGPTGNLGDGIGVFSANGSYHFRRASGGGRLVPFLTGGYSLFFRESSANGFNVGGGVNYWLGDRVGLRLEIRDQVADDYRARHFIGFRFGLAFR